MRRRQTLIFTYGTLRPGCGNDRMLGDYIHVGPAVIDGSLHYHECGLFPIYDPARPGIVRGDVLLADDSRVAEVIAMEVFAGYNAEWRTVRVFRWPDDPKRYEHVGNVLTFPWTGRVGERIESGDWTTTPDAYGIGRRHA